MAAKSASVRVPGERRVPVVTLLLIAANIVAAFALFVYPEFAYELGFRPDHPSFTGAITGLFLHANLFHLLGNMVFLAAVGAAVELATGSLRFATVYFLSGLAGVGVHYFATRNQADPVPLIGASGAIAGCAGYYSVRYTGLKVAFAPHRALSVAAVTGLWVLLQVAGAFIHIGEADSGGTAFWSHLGGFAAGVVLSFLFRAPDLTQIRLGHEVLDQMNMRGPGAAVASAERHLKQNPNDVKVLWDLAEAQRQLGETDKEADVLIRLVDLESGDQQIEAIRHLCQAGRISRLPTLRRLQLADRVREASAGVAKALLRSVVDGPKDEIQRPDAILSLAALEREEDQNRSEELLAELAGVYPLHPATDLARKKGWLS